VYIGENSGNVVMWPILPVVKGFFRYHSAEITGNALPQKAIFTLDFCHGVTILLIDGSAGRM